jgi:hypothetical protein
MSFQVVIAGFCKTIVYGQLHCVGYVPSVFVRESHATLSVLSLEADNFFEKLITTYHITRYHVSQDNSVHTHCREKCKWLYF